VDFLDNHNCNLFGLQLKCESIYSTITLSLFKSFITKEKLSFATSFCKYEMLFAIEKKLEMKIFLLMHILINFYEINIKFYGWILGKEWNNNKLLKWWHSMYHAKKVKNMNSKSMLQ
jgi:hypothetical protein